MEFSVLVAGFERPRMKFYSGKFLVNIFVWLVQRIRDPLTERKLCRICLTASYNIAKMDEKQRDLAEY